MVARWFESPLCVTRLYNTGWSPVTLNHSDIHITLSRTRFALCIPIDATVPKSPKNQLKKLHRRTACALGLSLGA